MVMVTAMAVVSGQAQTTTKSRNPSLTPTEVWSQEHLKNPFACSPFCLLSLWPQMWIKLQELSDKADKLNPYLSSQKTRKRSTWRSNYVEARRQRK